MHYAYLNKARLTYTVRKNNNEGCIYVPCNQNAVTKGVTVSEDSHEVIIIMKKIQDQGPIAKEFHAAKAFPKGSIS